MRQIPDKEVLMRVELKQKRQHLEVCQLVYEACVGRSIGEAARLLGYSQKSVREHLSRHALEAARSGKPTRRLRGT